LLTAKDYIHRYNEYRFHPYSFSTVHTYKGTVYACEEIVSAILGVDAITIEVNIDRGVNFPLVGLPDNTVRERG